MYSLTIAFGSTPAMWRLLFKTEAAAIAAHNQSSLQSDLPQYITDDFGQTCTVRPEMISGCLLEDLDQSKQAGIEMQLHTWRMQATAQTLGAAEPALRPLRGAPQGPSVFVPNGGGRMS